MNDLAIVASAYEELLKLSPTRSPSRTRLQSTLATLRDEIAHLIGADDGEQVQDFFERLTQARRDMGLIEP